MFRPITNFYLCMQYWQSLNNLFRRCFFSLCNSISSLRCYSTEILSLLDFILKNLCRVFFIFFFLFLFCFLFFILEFCFTTFYFVMKVFLRVIDVTKIMYSMMWYGHDIIPSSVCRLLSSCTLNAILLIFSANTYNSGFYNTLLCALFLLVSIAFMRFILNYRPRKLGLDFPPLTWLYCSLVVVIIHYRT